jgi:hypothetical protein
MERDGKARDPGSSSRFDRAQAEEGVETGRAPNRLRVKNSSPGKASSGEMIPPDCARRPGLLESTRVFVDKQ